MQVSKDIVFSPKSKSEINLGLDEEECDIHKWKSSKKKVHWWFHGLAESYSHNNEQVSHHSNNIEEQAHNEKTFCFFGFCVNPKRMK